MRTVKITSPAVLIDAACITHLHQAVTDGKSEYARGYLDGLRALIEKEEQ